MTSSILPEYANNIRINKIKQIFYNRIWISALLSFYEMSLTYKGMNCWSNFEATPLEHSATRMDQYHRLYVKKINYNNARAVINTEWLF